MTDVGKAYKVFGSPAGILLDAIGLGRFAPHREFWALRGFQLELDVGERVGLIGRNGAGKSTVLKLVTQNVRPTEGQVEVNGAVHALFEATGGLHPEFTGYENIRGSLEALGHSAAEIAASERDIEDFTELGRFLDQPLKTLSLGMQARLSFAIATSVEPEILIVDEVLGAGDAYFFGKAAERMRQLVESGAAVLIVSHALDQIVRFCEETIWLDRGRVVMRGPSTEVVKAYERFIRELADRRLRATNEKRRYQAFEREGHTDELEVELRGPVEVTRIALLRDGELEDEILVGDAQDADESESCYVVLGDPGWTASSRANGRFFRAVDETARAVFSLWFFYPQSQYTIELTYRSGGPAAASVTRLDNVVSGAKLPVAREWQKESLIIEPLGGVPRTVELGGVSRWPGARGLLIERVRVVDAEDRDRAVFEVGEPVSVIVDIAAEERGRYPLILAALVFRQDAIIVTRHVAERLELDVEESTQIEARLDLGPIQLGNGSYLLSVGLYRRLNVNDTTTSEIYDYFDRSFEFSVTGNPPLHDEVFRHPGRWSVVARERTQALPAKSNPATPAS
jgi:lipopolysaccharide transport system ATP-binding protein